MNVKKIASGLLALSIASGAAVSLSGCGKTGAMASYTDQNGKKIYQYEFNMYVQDDNEYPDDDENMQFDDFLKDKFGIHFHYDRIPRTDWETRTNTYFATNDAPEITTGGKEPNYKGWAIDEMLLPVADSFEDLKAKMPNYVKLFGDDAEEVYELAASSDGKLYYLPSVRQEKTQMCWLYRKDIFEELGLEFPETTDEFIEVCKKIKEKYPDKIIISSNGQKKSSLTGFFQAFGIPELILSDQSYVDRDGNFVPYALTTDDAREMYKFLKQLYDNDLIDREILSIEKDKFYSRCAQNNAFVTYNYIYNAETFTKKTDVKGSDGEGGEWTWTPNMLTNDKSRGTVYKKDPKYSNWGPAFSTACGSEEGKLDAVLKFYDWAATQEGSLYTTYGIEGESYKLVTLDEYEKLDKEVKLPVDEIPEDWIVERDGVKYVPETLDTDKGAEGWYHQTENTKGTKISAAYGITTNVFLKHPKMFYETRGYQIDTLWDAYQEKEETSNYYTIDAFPMRYTSEEQSRYTDLTTSLDTKRDEYMARFLYGEMDPSNDDDWNKYLSDMKRVGLDDFTELQTTVYNRTQSEINS